MRTRARAIAGAGGLEPALASGALPKLIDTTFSEALVLGLLKQGVRKYLAIFGHGSTDLGEVLRVYEEEGVTRTFNCRNEVAMAHAATALRWQYGETPAVVTSIGPGAMQAFAGAWPRRRTGRRVAHLRRRDDVRRRLQHAAGAEGGAGPVRPDDGDPRPLLRTAHARSDQRCPTPRRDEVNHPFAPGRSSSHAAQHAVDADGGSTLRRYRRGPRYR